MLGNSKTLNESESRPVIKVNATNYVPESENESIVEELEEIVPSSDKSLLNSIKSNSVPVKSIKPLPVKSMAPVSMMKTKMSGMVNPPSPESSTESMPEPDSIIPSLKSVTQQYEKQQGGSLYGSLMKSAYTLAPTAVLLAAAEAMFKCRKSKSRKTRRQTQRKQRRT